ncbi:unnamed protein product [Protopolystoma xenopodis]|uniref:Uncharacterized protein n=1 Tax=Protopolystoma xenopodis TaxID=117903 RepID=A0A3S5AFT4_9PLAT|nr:unnamed protein product [Protopolystoma xenopodis]
MSAHFGVETLSCKAVPGLSPTAFSGPLNPNWLTEVLEELRALILGFPSNSKDTLTLTTPNLADLTNVKRSCNKSSTFLSKLNQIDPELRLKYFPHTSRQLYAPSSDYTRHQVLNWTPSLLTSPPMTCPYPAFHQRFLFGGEVASEVP